MRSVSGVSGDALAVLAATMEAAARRADAADRLAEPPRIAAGEPARPAQDLVDDAGRAIEVLHGLGRGLRFVADDAGGLHAEVTDRHGAVLRHLSPADALALLDGLGRR